MEAFPSPSHSHSGHLGITQVAVGPRNHAATAVENAKDWISVEINEFVTSEEVITIVRLIDEAFSIHPLFFIDVHSNKPRTQSHRPKRIS